MSRFESVEPGQNGVGRVRAVGRRRIHTRGGFERRQAFVDTDRRVWSRLGVLHGLGEKLVLDGFDAGFKGGMEVRAALDVFNQAVERGGNVESGRFGRGAFGHNRGVYTRLAAQSVPRGTLPHDPC